MLESSIEEDEGSGLQPYARLVSLSSDIAARDLLLLPSDDNDDGRDKEQYGLYLLGRSSKCNYIFKQKFISSEHCKLYCLRKNNERYGMFVPYIEDTSSNGTFIKTSTRLKKGVRRVLHDGDLISLVNPDTSQDGATSTEIESTSFYIHLFLSNDTIVLPSLGMNALASTRYLEQDVMHCSGSAGGEHITDRETIANYVVDKDNLFQIGGNDIEKNQFIDSNDCSVKKQINFNIDDNNLLPLSTLECSSSSASFRVQTTQKQIPSQDNESHCQLQDEGAGTMIHVHTISCNNDRSCSSASGNYNGSSNRSNISSDSSSTITKTNATTATASTTPTTHSVRSSSSAGHGITRPSPFISNLRKRIISSEDLGTTNSAQIDFSSDCEKSNVTTSATTAGGDSNSRETSLDFLPEIIELKSGRRKSLSRQDSESLRLARSQHSLLSDPARHPSSSSSQLVREVTPSFTKKTHSDSIAEEPSALLRDTYRNELYIAFSALLACMMTEDQNPAAKNNSTRNTSNTRNSRSDSFISTLQSEGPNSDIISFDIFANWSEIQDVIKEGTLCRDTIEMEFETLAIMNVEGISGIDFDSFCILMEQLELLWQSLSHEKKNNVKKSNNIHNDNNEVNSFNHDQEKDKVAEIIEYGNIEDVEVVEEEDTLGREHLDRGQTRSNEDDDVSVFTPPRLRMVASDITSLTRQLRSHRDEHHNDYNDRYDYDDEEGEGRGSSGEEEPSDKDVIEDLMMDFFSDGNNAAPKRQPKKKEIVISQESDRESVFNLNQIAALRDESLRMQQIELKQNAKYLLSITKQPVAAKTVRLELAIHAAHNGMLLQSKFRRNANMEQEKLKEEIRLKEYLARRELEVVRKKELEKETIDLFKSLKLKIANIEKDQIYEEQIISIKKMIEFEEKRMSVLWRVLLESEKKFFTPLECRELSRLYLHLKRVTTVDSTKVSAAVHSKAVKTLAQLSRGVVSLHCVVVEETVPSNPLHDFLVQPFSSLQWLQLIRVPPSTIEDFTLLRSQLIRLEISNAGINQLNELFGNPTANILMKLKKFKKEYVFTKSLDDRNHLPVTYVLNLDHFVETENKGKSQVNLLWPNLLFLRLSNCGLTHLDSSLFLLPFVKQLDLTQNSISRIKYLKGCLNLRILNLSHNKISSLLFASSALSNIQRLNISHNSVKSLKGIEKLTFLEKLDISFNQITRIEEVLFLVKLKYIDDLHMAGNPVATLYATTEASGCNLHKHPLYETFMHHYQRLYLQYESPSNNSSIFSSSTSIQRNIPKDISLYRVIVFSYFYPLLSINGHYRNKEIICLDGETMTAFENSVIKASIFLPPEVSSTIAPTYYDDIKKTIRQRSSSGSNRLLSVDRNYKRSNNRFASRESYSSGSKLSVLSASALEYEINEDDENEDHNVLSEFDYRERFLSGADTAISSVDFVERKFPTALPGSRAHLYERVLFRRQGRNINSTLCKDSLQQFEERENIEFSVHPKRFHIRRKAKILDYDEKLLGLGFMKHFSFNNDVIIHERYDII